jgi:hypothetical protein
VKNGSIAGQFSALMPAPVSATVTRTSFFSIALISGSACAALTDHRVARSELDERLLQLGRARAHRRRRLVPANHLDAGAGQLAGATELDRVVEGARQLDRRGVGAALALGEPQHVLHDLADAQRLALQILQQRRGRVAAREIGEQQLDDARRTGQRVVDLVRDAGAQLTRADSERDRSNMILAPAAARSFFSSTRFSSVWFQAMISLVCWVIFLRAPSRALAI